MTHAGRYMTILRSGMTRWSVDHALDHVPVFCFMLDFANDYYYYYLRNIGLCSVQNHVALLRIQRQTGELFKINEFRSIWSVSRFQKNIDWALRNSGTCETAVAGETNRLLNPNILQILQNILQILSRLITGFAISSPSVGRLNRKSLLNCCRVIAVDLLLNQTLLGLKHCLVRSPCTFTITVWPKRIWLRRGRPSTIRFCCPKMIRKTRCNTQQFALY